MLLFSFYPKIEIVDEYSAYSTWLEYKLSKFAPSLKISLWFSQEQMEKTRN